MFPTDHTARVLSQAELFQKSSTDSNASPNESPTYAALAPIDTAAMIAVMADDLEVLTEISAVDLAKLLPEARAHLETIGFEIFDTAATLTVRGDFEAHPGISGYIGDIVTLERSAGGEVEAPPSPDDDDPLVRILTEFDSQEGDHYYVLLRETLVIIGRETSEISAGEISAGVRTRGSRKRGFILPRAEEFAAITSTVDELMSRPKVLASYTPHPLTHPYPNPHPYPYPPLPSPPTLTHPYPHPYPHPTQRSAQSLR